MAERLSRDLPRERHPELGDVGKRGAFSRRDPPDRGAHRGDAQVGDRGAGDRHHLGDAAQVRGAHGADVQPPAPRAVHRQSGQAGDQGPQALSDRQRASMGSAGFRGSAAARGLGNAGGSARNSWRSPRSPNGVPSSRHCPSCGSGRRRRSRRWISWSRTGVTISRSRSSADRRKEGSPVGDQEGADPGVGPRRRARSKGHSRGRGFGLVHQGGRRVGSSSRRRRAARV